MYDVVPSSKPVNVTHAGSVVIAEPFQVMGFSVSGRVVDRSGNGIEGAAISVDGVHKTTTDKDGTYKLDQIQSGKYAIKASKPHVFFHPLKSVSVVPSTGSLPDIVVTTYHVCGVVNSGEPVKTRSVALTASSGQSLTSTTTDADGHYCFEVAPGAYTVCYVFSPVLFASPKPTAYVLCISFCDENKNRSPLS